MLFASYAKDFLVLFLASSEARICQRDFFVQIGLKSIFGNFKVVKMSNPLPVSALHAEAALCSSPRKNVWHPLWPSWLHLNTALAGCTVNNAVGLAWTKIWTNMQIYVIEKYADICRNMQFRNMYKYAKICIYMHIYKYAIYASWKYAIICNYMQKDKYA